VLKGDNLLITSVLLNGLTCAHIVANTGKLSDYECWGKSTTIANYINDIDPYASANLLVLCGTKGGQGTCHDAFDKLSTLSACITTMLLAITYGGFAGNIHVADPMYP